MQLNNKGWSLNTLLICIAVLLLFLMLSIFNAYKLSARFANDFKQNGNINNVTDINNSSDSNNNDSINDNSNSGSSETNASSTSIPTYYATKESQLAAATIRYLRENAITVADDEKIVVRISDIIKDKFIQNIKDEKTNNICEAYSVVGYKDNDYQVIPYISCDSYVTANYGVTE